MGLFSRKKTEEHYIINACYNGDIDYVRKYISCGKDVNVSERKNSPLLAAISQHQVEIVELLMNNGADVNFNPDKNLTVLGWAVDCANYQTFSEEEKHKEAPTEIIELLLKYGADINLKDRYGSTPLETAKRLITKSGTVPRNIIDLLEKND